MSQVEREIERERAHQYTVPMVAETAWGLYDFVYSASAAQWTFVAGSAVAGRFQLDRFRRVLQMIDRKGQLQLWVWSTVDFVGEIEYYDGFFRTQRFYPNAYPKSKTLPTLTVPAEVRVYSTTGTGQTLAFPNTQTTTAFQMTIAGRYHANHSVIYEAQNFYRLGFTFPGSTAPIKVLAIAHNNQGWAGLQF